MDDLKPKLGKYYLLILSIIIIVILLLYFVLLKVDPAEYTKYLVKLNSTAMNRKLLALNNANTIYNLPNITLQTNNTDLDNLIDCKNTLKYLGPYVEDALKTYDNLCKSSCGGSGELLVVKTDRDYVYDNEFVKVGVYCTVDPKPCNLNTGYVAATINSNMCLSRYPRMFGGATAASIIACSDEKNPSTGSVLWDYANNEAVDPTTIVMTHEDETLPDGSYRFRCKYNETSNGNPFIPHPVDRLHPIKDKCNDSIYRADYSVHANVTDTGWTCECGDFSTTRVKHLNAGDPQSICTSCFREVRDGNMFKVPYICYNKDSPYLYAKHNQPCISYDRHGNSCDAVELKIDVIDREKLFINTKLPNLDENELSTKYEVYRH
ncbi:Pif-2 [Homarus gammarus nudivirus]|uniref:Pif-2 n=1 Tax=Homarus gammarus nudivirus TaxID=2509616 RepID=A0A411HB53_9VIRU|nr:Pif-2 [Homarus gammarus nudivirus]QBB28614.1 Pif-2 [Homarus gammarus nudivirus]